jgi:hypothetical protein
VSENLLKPLNRTGGFEQSLLFRELDVQVAHHLVRKNERVMDRRDSTRYLGRDFRTRYFGRAFRTALRVNSKGGNHRPH